MILLAIVHNGISRDDLLYHLFIENEINFVIELSSVSFSTNGNQNFGTKDTPFPVFPFCYCNPQGALIGSGGNPIGMESERFDILWLVLSNQYLRVGGYTDCTHEMKTTSPFSGQDFHHSTKDKYQKLNYHKLVLHFLNWRTQSLQQIILESCISLKV